MWCREAAPCTGEAAAVDTTSTLRKRSAGENYQECGGTSVLEGVGSQRIHGALPSIETLVFGRLFPRIPKQTRSSGLCMQVASGHENSGAGRRTCLRASGDP